MHYVEILRKILSINRCMLDYDRLKSFFIDLIKSGSCPFLYDYVIFILSTPVIFYVIIAVSIITSPPRSIQIDIHSLLQMPCEASGYPQPSITWSRNGRPITELLTEPHIATDRNNSLNVA